MYRLCHRNAFHEMFLTIDVKTTYDCASAKSDLLIQSFLSHKAQQSVQTKNLTQNLGRLGQKNVQPTVVKIRVQIMFLVGSIVSRCAVQ